MMEFFESVPIFIWIFVLYMLLIVFICLIVLWGLKKKNVFYPPSEIETKNE